jgi:hypothetical protein
VNVNLVGEQEHNDCCSEDERSERDGWDGVSTVDSVPRLRRRRLVVVAAIAWVDRRRGRRSEMDWTII